MSQLEKGMAQKHEGMLVALLEIRQQILGRISLAILEVSSVTAHAICERDRTQQLADRLREAEGARVKQQTLWAVIFGGVAGIATGAFGLAAGGATGAALAPLVGGVLTGTLSVTALYNETQQDFQHGDNLLKEIWADGDLPRYLPRSIWRFLHRAMKEDVQGRTFRDELLAGWMQEGRLGTPGTKTAETRIALLFGGGGSYRIPDLLARAQMLDMLEATVSLMHQDLEQLLRQVLIREALMK